jgi:hypothetical protein
MSLETDLVALVKTRCAQVFPNEAKLNTPRPYVIWSRIGGASNTYLEGTLPNLRNAMIRLEAWADTQGVADALIALIEQDIAAQTMGQAVSESVTGGDIELVLSMTRQDFTIWATR